MRRWRLRPSAESRQISRVAAIPFTLVAAAFVVIGVTTVIPSGAGLFGWVFTGMAACFCGFGLWSVFGKRPPAERSGFDLEEQDGAAEERDGVSPLGPAAKLEELNTMYVKGLITRDEYDAKKKEILDRM